MIPGARVAGVVKPVFFTPAKFFRDNLKTRFTGLFTVTTIDELTAAAADRFQYATLCNRAKKVQRVFDGPNQTVVGALNAVLVPESFGEVFVSAI